MEPENHWVVEKKSSSKGPILRFHLHLLAPLPRKIQPPHGPMPRPSKAPSGFAHLPRPREEPRRLLGRLATRVELGGLRQEPRARLADLGPRWTLPTLPTPRSKMDGTATGIMSARPLAAVLFLAKKGLRMASCLHKLGTLLDLSACSCTLKLGTLLDLCAPLLNQNYGTLLCLCTGTPPLAKMAKFRCPL